MRGGRHSVRVALAAASSALSWTASAAPPVQAEHLGAASAFLQAYRDQSEAQAAAFYDLYSDRAVIHAGLLNHAQSVAFPGRAFKAWGRQLLSEGQSALDGSVFHDITVEEHGSRLVIRAKRYSTTRCYWDTSYQVAIERDGAAYQIVEEHLTTNPASRCMTAATSAPSVGTPGGLSSHTGMAQPIAPPTAEPWHPLSQQELASQALKLTQAVAATRPSAAAATGDAAPTDGNSVAQPQASLTESPAVVSSRWEDASGDARQTAAERP